MTTVSPSAKRLPSSQPTLVSQTSTLAKTEHQFLGSLGRRVREFRENLNMTRKVLAQEANVSERYLSQLEAGDGNISIVLLRRIAIALKIPLVFLFPDEH